MLYSFNYELFWLLFSYARTSVFIDGVIVFFATWLLWVMVGIMVVMAVAALLPRVRYYRRRNIELLVYALVSGCLARFAIIELMYVTFPSLRPYQVFSEIVPLVDKTTQSSFPSGHASWVFAFAASVLYFYPKVGLLFFLFAFMVGVGRVAAGAHWPVDIIGGAIAGVLAAWVVHSVGEKISHGGTGSGH